MKPYYSEYVRHCLRFYIKTLDEGRGGHPIFRNEAERYNWRACHDVLKDYSERDMDTIAYIYRPGDTIADKIYLLSKTKLISQDAIWALISSTERKVAQKRGLV